MGVASRAILPVCDTLCFFCPSLRTRSRQPIKRYKKILADIFPKSEDEEPNDRKIGKLCEYAAKNPLRVPKITDYLEQRCYKELRSERYGYAKVVLCIYRKLVLSCPKQMPLFASSLLNVIRALLDQMRQDDMQTMGCETLADFIYSQVDSTYMSNIESLVPKLCDLSKEMGDDERSMLLRSAGLQALASMIWFMGDHSHICSDFDEVVSVVLENYGSPKTKGDILSESSQTSKKWVQEVLKEEHVLLSDDVARVHSWNRIINDNGKANLTVEEAKDPKMWSRICIHNMSNLTKEVITTRRVLDSLFRYFQNGSLWSPQHGLALPVLLDMQFLMEQSGENTHVLISILVKHLDHKSVIKQPNMQINIVQVTIRLAQQAKVQNSVAIVGAVSDLMRHWRKTMHFSGEDKNIGDDTIKLNKELRSLIEDCIIKLADKVGDAGPLLEVMAVMLENIPIAAVVARTTVSTVYRMAQIVVSIPTLSFHDKEFPETLFHQLLLGMVHPDHETRVGAHRIFAVVLVPSSPSRPRTHTTSASLSNFQRTLSRTASVFSSSAVRFEKLKKEKASFRDGVRSEAYARDGRKCEYDARFYSLPSSHPALNLKSCSLASPMDRSSPMGRTSVSDYKEPDFISLRLSSQQITFLFSSIWAQATSPENLPENFEAIAHTYSLALLYTRAQATNHEALIRSFQIAFSLRSISLSEGSLQPCRRRSLFTLSTSMIVFLARAYNLQSFVPLYRACLRETTVDPFLHLAEDGKLQAVCAATSAKYGSREDDASALRSIQAISACNVPKKETMASAIVKSLGKLPDVMEESSSMMQEMLEEFSHDDICPMEAQLFLENPRACSPFEMKEYHSLDEAQLFLENPRSCSPIEMKEYHSLDEMAHCAVTVDDDTGHEAFERQIVSNVDLSLQAPPLLSVNQLLDSVIEAAQVVGRLSVSIVPEMPFNEITNKCEAVMLGKQQKMSAFMNIDHTVEFSLFGSVQSFQETRLPYIQSDQFLQLTAKPFSEDPFFMNPNQSNGELPSLLISPDHHNPFFRLPASSPYDNFLKAAGC